MVSVPAVTAHKQTRYTADTHTHDMRCGQPHSPAPLDPTKAISLLRRNSRGNVTCPTLLLHGTRDEVVDPRNTEALHERFVASGRARCAPPHYVEGAGHNDVVEVNPPAYFRVIGDFLASLRV